MTSRPRAMASLVAEELARRILSRPVKYVHHPSFDGPTAQEAALWLGPMPGQEEYAAKKATLRVPPRVDPQMREHYRWPLLAADQEVHLFRQMNFLKMGLVALRCRLASGDLSCLAQAQEAQARADAVRQALFCANRRIAVGIAKRFAAQQCREFWEVLADGDVSLLSAVENFDFGFGFKFSTYAYWSVLRNYTRNLPKRERKHRNTVPYEDADAFPAPAGEAPFREEDAREAAAAVGRVLSYLEPRERVVVRLRNGLGGRPPMTLLEVGSQLGITKERARQVEGVARYKMGVIARNLCLAAP